MQGDVGPAFSRASELSSTIGEYLEKIVALANEIPPLWQISPRLSSNYVRVTDVLLPSLRELVAEVIASRLHTHTHTHTHTYAHTHTHTYTQGDSIAAPRQPKP